MSCYRNAARYFLIVVLLLHSTVCGAATSWQSLQQTLQAVNDADTALAIIEQQDEARQHWSALNQGDYFILLASWQEKGHRLTEAIDSYSQAIALLEPLRVSPQLVKAYLERAYLGYVQTNDKRVYCPDRSRALSYARALQQPKVLVQALSASAFCFNSSRDFTQGVALLAEALAIATKESLPPNRHAMIYNATGILYRDNFIYDQAAVYIQKAYQLWLSVDDRQDMFNMLHTLVAIEINRGNWHKAQGYVDALFDLAKRSPQFDDFYFFSHYNAGTLAYSQQHYEQAAAAFERAIALKDSTSEHYFVRQCYAYYAAASYALGKQQQAAVAARQYLALTPNSDKEKANVLQAEAIIAVAADDAQLAVQKLLKIIALKEQEKIEFVHNAISSSSAIHDSKVAQYENQLLTQRLAIETLKATSAKDKQHIAYQTVVIIALLALSLLALTVFLAISRKYFKRRSQTDYLTQIANRRYTMEKGQLLLQAAQRKHTDFSIILFDIDHFKQVNDSYGHDVGDEVIKVAAQQVMHGLSARDLVGRIGGEEFLVLLPETSHQTAIDIAERLRTGIASKDFMCKQLQIKFTISLGVASRAQETNSIDELIRQADLALYRAKHAGRNNTQSAAVMSVSETTKGT